MNQRRKLSILTLLTFCFIVACFQTIAAQSQKTSFHFTILKSTGEPQKGIFAKINGYSEEYTANEQGIINFDFEISSTYTRTLSFFFTSNKEKSVYSLPMSEENAAKTIYLDSPEDIILFKQQNKTFPIEGFVLDEEENPIKDAIIHIQGTGRKVKSDEIGLFQAEADYNHPIAIRVEGMENRILHISQFLQTPHEPYKVIMQRKGQGKVYSVVEQMPEFPRGGMKAFSNYVKRNLKYPAKALKDSIEGAVGIQFIVETNGEITSPVIVRRLEPSMDTAALTLIKQMPRWIPASDNGTKVRCRYSVPVLFKLPKPQPAQKALPKPDSLTIKPMIADTLNRDSLSTTTLSTDSLSIIGDNLLHKTDSIQLITDSIQLKPDSLSIPSDSILTVPTDSLQTDSTKVNMQNEQSTAPKPKKRNIFVRFFRWLFGIKD